MADTAAAAEQIFDDILDFSGDMRDLADDHYQKLDAKLRGWWTATFPSDAGAVSLEKPEVQRLSPGDVPTIPEFDFNPVLGDFDPNQWLTNRYTSPFLDFLESTAREVIGTGGPGISQSVQDALFNYQRERDTQTANDELLMARQDFAATGFPLPTDMLMAREAEIVTRYGNVRIDRNREILAKMAELAQDSMKALANTGVSIEQVRADFTTKIAKLYIDMTTALIAQAKARIDLHLAEFEGKVKILLAKADIEIKNAEAMSSYQSNLIEKYKVEVDRDKAKARHNLDTYISRDNFDAAILQSMSSYLSSVIGTAHSQVNAVVTAGGK
jgi:hypothetical protein